MKLLEVGVIGFAAWFILHFEFFELVRVPPFESCRVASNECERGDVFGDHTVHAEHRISTDCGVLVNGCSDTKGDPLMHGDMTAEYGVVGHGNSVTEVAIVGDVRS